MPWPDWRKPEEYPDPELAPPKRWAWEFLRRNPEYQEDYRQLCEEDRYYIVPGIANYIPYPELGLKIPANGDEEFQAMITEGTSPLARTLERKWGIKPHASPEVDDAWKWLSIEPATVSTHQPEAFGRTLRLPIDGVDKLMKVVQIFGPDGFRTKLRDSEILVKIDVSGPIEDQLKTAGRLLKMYRDAFKFSPYAERDHRHLWPIYLRLLDARSEPSPESWGKLADLLTSEAPEPGWDETKARKAHEAAAALSDNGWKFIASRHPDLEKERARKRKVRPGK